MENLFVANAELERFLNINMICISNSKRRNVKDFNSYIIINYPSNLLNRILSTWLKKTSGFMVRQLGIESIST